MICQDILLGLQEELHKTIIFITHDLDEALRIGDNIVILRDGAVIQKGAPQEIVLNPVDDYVRDFIKDINRARVLDVKSVMTEGKSDTELSFASTTILEKALPAMSNANAEVANVIPRWRAHRSGDHPGYDSGYCQARSHPRWCDLPLNLAKEGLIKPKSRHSRVGGSPLISMVYRFPPTWE